ncbi:DNA repair protein RecN [Alteromonas sp. 14N.309.X.WAT.G.H12]|uniref:DNA repair protein RecN n=1 Tax=Alteromonas sp. 14N.309.X.WAT.G.H12 TaxID=3120824 RepID=UPI002FD467BB
MLLSLTITNYTITKQLQLDWAGGFTSITGETGAGKSVTLDALALCLGARGDTDKIYEGADHLAVSAEFDVEDLPAASALLHDEGVLAPDSPHSCIIRRVIKRKDRPKATVNGHPVTVQFLKHLGTTLASIHGQHAYHELLGQGTALNLLDCFAQNQSQKECVSHAFNVLQKLRKEKNQLVDATAAFKERHQLLSFQRKELDDFAPLIDEFPALEIEQKKLSHAAELHHEASAISTLLDGDGGRQDGAITLIRTVIRKMEDMVLHDEGLKPQLDSLHTALADVEDVSAETARYTMHIDVDPQRVVDVDKRFSKYVNLAKKYQVLPEDLAQHHEAVISEMDAINDNEGRLDAINEEISEAESHYLACAQRLSKTRAKASQYLSDSVTKNIQRLNMSGAQCLFSLTPINDITKGNANGLDDVTILVSTNGNASLKPLSKVASGGEISRINLVIQLIIAQKQDTPTLLFDEVDVGISGPTASVVGSLLKELGESTQVISITHLPQVACYGHQHYHVKKEKVNGKMSSGVTILHDEERVEEIARLLSGSSLTKKALENARELLENGRDSCSPH